MSQVKQSELGGLGLYATKSYAPGDTILEETPLIVLAPSYEKDQELVNKLFGSQKQQASTSQNSNEKGGTLWDIIEPPSDVPKESHGRFRSMVQAGLVFEYEKEKRHDDAQWTKLEDEIFKLYHPAVGNDESKKEESSTEKEVVNLAQQACDYIRKNTKQPRDPTSDNSLQKVMLIWACNSFEGGRVYAETSRVNHSCNPNAIIKVDTESSQLQKTAAAAGASGEEATAAHSDHAQKVVAAAPIAAGDEITISYLGILLYSDTSFRRDILQRQKMFFCGCSRCGNDCDDKAGCIPCPVCHPRQEPQGILDEDVQYDDEQTVNYVTMATACDQCQTTPNAMDKRQRKKLQKIITNVANKVSSYLEDRQAAMTSRKKSSGEDSGDEMDQNDELLEEHISLSSTVTGAKHWTTNLLLLIHLDRRLSNMSQVMLTTQELPEMEDIAEVIDSLERVCRFVEGLDLKLHHGHIVADAVIGVARMLVSLGDEKSQKYAAEWLDKLGDYVNLFETEGRQKVVETLKQSWKKHKSNDGDEPVKKKAKPS